MKRVEAAVNSLNSFHQNNTRFCLRALLSRNWQHVWQRRRDRPQAHDGHRAAQQGEGDAAGELAARQPLALDGQPEQHEADAEAAAAAAAPPAHAGQEQEAPDAALHHQL